MDLALLRHVLVLGALALALLAAPWPARGQESGAGHDPTALGAPVPARTVGEVNLRSGPATGEGTLLRTVPNNTKLDLAERITAEDGATWHRTTEGEYVYIDNLRIPRTPPKTYDQPWLDVDLAEPAMITAYEDGRPVYSALFIRGMESDPTPEGEFTILRRVENETMDSATLGRPNDEPGGWYRDNVLYTQYFTDDGSALHYNWWTDNWGGSGSRGCVGLSEDDALWFWNWAQVGMPVHVSG